VLPALVFTLDGVLVDSEPVKLQSFAEACRDVWRLSDEELQTIQVYNARQRGVPRKQKFEFVHRHLVMRGDNASVSRVNERYGELLAQRLVSVPLLPGVRHFLETVPGRRFVLSAAPEDEVTNTLLRHGIDGAFEALFASAAGKAETLRRIAAAVEGPVVFFGDAPSDQAAAVATAVRFVAVNPNDQLRPHVSEWVADFTDLATVRRLAALPLDLDLGEHRSAGRSGPSLTALPQRESPWPMLAQGLG
jgi:phosphoglycolate phosphatase-like HAD superfamily hydrolase